MGNSKALAYRGANVGVIAAAGFNLSYNGALFRGIMYGRHLPTSLRPALLLLAVGALAGCGGTIKNIDHDSETKPPVEGTPPDIYLSASSYDFGALALGERVSTTVNVDNRGSEDLLISSVTVDAPFTVSQGLVSITGGSNSTVTVTVEVDDYLPHTSAVTFASNDPDTPSATFTVSVSAITDADGDGHTLVAAGGDDCDDEDPNAYLGAAEIWYDNIDENCDGLSDWDQDGDGYETDAHNTDPEAGGGDCQDLKVEYHPNAEDAPYDNRDTNCDQQDDYDADGDGSRSDDYGAGTDCDDNDPTVNTSGVETLNAKDDDCDGVTDIGASGAGAAYIYDATGTYDRAGYATALADVDGDGREDVIVGSAYTGAPGPAASGKGAISVFLAGPLPASGTEVGDADNYFRSATLGDLLGSAVARVGDFDGDSTADIAFSATGYSSGAGAVYVLSGEDAASGGDTSTALFTLTGAASNAAGRGLASDVDLNGDGVYDLVAAYASGSNNAVAIVYGPASGTVAITAADANYTTDGTESAFYRNAPVGGDVDGDGYGDLLLADGAADYGGYTDNGALWALFGRGANYTTSSAEDIEGTATVLAAGTSNSEGNAWAVGLGGDLNGDGAQELWIYSSGGSALYEVLGGPSRRAAFDPASSATITYTWGSSSPDVDQIRNVGDWTGDGLDDIFVVAEDAAGSYGRSEMFSSELAGGTYLERSAMTASLLGTSADDNANLGYGQSAVSGDVDGDGDMDIVTGDPDYGSGAGRAYVFLNSPVE
jgi:hypothetical protein